MSKKIFFKNRTKSSDVGDKISNQIEELIEFTNFKATINPNQEIECVIKYSPDLNIVAVKSISNFIESGISKVGADIFIMASFTHKVELLKHFDDIKKVLYIGIRKSKK